MHVRRPKGVAYTALGAEPLRCGVWGEPMRAGQAEDAIGGVGKGSAFDSLNVVYYILRRLSGCALTPLIPAP